MTNDTAPAIVLEMESRYHCRYEPGGLGCGCAAFPVTHVLNAEARPGYPAPAFAWIGIGNIEILNYRIYSATGMTLVHGSERNYGRTRLGYIQMLKLALQHVRAYNARRVYPRDLTHRAPAAGLNPWVRSAIWALKSTLTADTVTDAQIREMIETISLSGLDMGAARGALRSPDPTYRKRCRARCADILNRLNRSV